MPQVMMWVLRKAAAVAIESIMVNLLVSLLPGRSHTTADLTRAALPAGEPAAERPSEEVDPKVLLLAEMISTALAESDAGQVQAVVADGIGPSISVIVVNAPAEHVVADAVVVEPAQLTEQVDDGADDELAA